MHLLIGTPCYGGMVSHNYLNSVIRLKELCLKYNIECTIHTIGNESLITRGRSYFVSIILTNKIFTHLLFIDADISFNPESVIRMIMSDKDVIAGIYPKKNINYTKLIECVKHNVENKTSMAVPQSIYDYCINLEKIENIKCDKGIIEAMYVGTGFMMIKRQVIEKMVEAYPETKYNNDVEGYCMNGNENNFYMLFDCIIDPVSKRYLSEDFTFCYRWRSLGGKIYADLGCDLTHTGTYDWQGSFRSIFSINPMTMGGDNTQMAPPPPIPPPQMQEQLPTQMMPQQMMSPSQMLSPPQMMMPSQMMR